ncbi:hypothetical protein EJV47_18950 [Hymenobacter gummosus]|uniref:GyrI-like domain-containing protein n=1 Tax=Hymenobacter gummosus TaxID=1776032 RepID=A0A431TYS9_9BACT|nr:hypothetical protein [Hymenobacter gummosus]RTQ47500.1 hypothetical protein EJV47_18950 [Hymenobacter gummosus]
MRWFLIIGGALVAVFVGVYVWLGGLKPPTVELLTTEQPVFLAGKPFKGVPNAEFGKLTGEVAELQRRGTVRGVLGNIFYNDVEKQGQPVEAFVGLVVPDTTQRLPIGYRYRVFAGGQKVLRARTDASFMLAPGQLYSAVKDEAEKRKLKLRNVFVEQYPENGTSEVLATVQ